MARDGLPITPDMDAFDRVLNEWRRGPVTLLARSAAARSARAEQARQQGAPVAFPVKGSRRRIVCGPQLFEVKNGEAAELSTPLASLGAALNEGTYTFRGEGRSVQIPRDDIGDILVLEGVFLKDAPR
jgi:hypothetical protein